MFSLDDKSYWIIVTKDESDELYAIKQSQDVYDEDLVPYPSDTLGYNDIDEEWANGKPTGVYRLEVEAVKDEDGDLQEVKVIASELLYEIKE